MHTNNFLKSQGAVTLIQKKRLWHSQNINDTILVDIMAMFRCHITADSFFLSKQSHAVRRCFLLKVSSCNRRLTVGRLTLPVMRVTCTSCKLKLPFTRVSSSKQTLLVMSNVLLIGTSCCKGCFLKTESSRYKSNFL